MDFFSVPSVRALGVRVSRWFSRCRWPLLIDPQLQGVKWIKQKERDSLVTVQITRQKKWIQKVMEAMRNGDFLLIEGIGEEIDAILDPLLARAVVKKGRSSLIKLAGEDVEFLPKFTLALQTKLSNPHYAPEVAAQCTVVNFTVTPEGLEEQILALIVNAEQPDLEHTKRELVRKQNEFKVALAQLEDALLVQLSNADPATILSNTELVEGLETTKNTATEIQEQVRPSTPQTVDRKTRTQTGTNTHNRHKINTQTQPATTKSPNASDSHTYP
ncbi:dynein heavy chain family protein [Toxoplasma gondii ARI]|uniref:Dynein heavy chain family protein n=1 Tax=Toxoplasma gondii ARI TaxID=1074872 RepID=A0A139XZS3_TOXGO|nr:dynein heavy chain family protein [Toxoplasma gondii ARI]